MIIILAIAIRVAVVVAVVGAVFILLYERRQRRKQRERDERYWDDNPISVENYATAFGIQREPHDTRDSLRIKVRKHLGGS